jgi:periplasmic copper chaperone A
VCRLFPLLALVGAAACSEDDGAAAIEVRGAWTRPTPAGSSTAAVYMSVRAADDDTLVGASVDASIATNAMAHETVSSGGQLSMDLAAGVTLPGGEDVAFEPGGLHVMLEDLAEPLVAGQELALTLAFEHAPDVAITVLVRDDAP